MSIRTNRMGFASFLPFVFFLLQNIKWVISGLKHIYLDLHFLSPKQMGSPKSLICTYFTEHWYFNTHSLCILRVCDFWKLECLLSGIILSVGDSFWTIQSNEDSGAQLFFPPLQSSQQTMSELVMFSAAENALINQTFFFPAPSVPWRQGTSWHCLLYNVYSYNLH